MKKGRRRKFDYASTVEFHGVDLEDVPKVEEYKEIPGREKSFSIDVIAVSLLLAFLAFLVVIGWTTDWGRAISIGAGVGIVVAGWRIIFVLDREEPAIEKQVYMTPVFIEEGETETSEPNKLKEFSTSWKKVEIASADGRVAKFYQPKAGELANWLAMVINDARDDSIPLKEKINLSKRTAIKKRGWTEGLYEKMIQQFYLMGWVVKGRNSVPEPTRAGISAFQAWLRLHPPSPLIGELNSTDL